MENIITLNGHLCQIMASKEEWDGTVSKTPKEGEIVFYKPEDSDTPLMKVGDGNTPLKDLPLFSSGTAEGDGNTTYSFDTDGYGCLIVYKQEYGETTPVELGTYQIATAGNGLKYDSNLNIQIDLGSEEHLGGVENKYIQKIYFDSTGSLKAEVGEAKTDVKDIYGNLIAGRLNSEGNPTGKLGAKFTWDNTIQGDTVTVAVEEQDANHQQGTVLAGNGNIISITNPLGGPTGSEELYTGMAVGNAGRLSGRYGFLGGTMNCGTSPGCVVFGSRNLVQSNFGTCFGANNYLSATSLYSAVIAGIDNIIGTQNSVIAGSHNKSHNKPKDSSSYNRFLLGEGLLADDVRYGDNLFIIGKYNTLPSLYNKFTCQQTYKGEKILDNEGKINSAILINANTTKKSDKITVKYNGTEISYPDQTSGSGGSSSDPITFDFGGDIICTLVYNGGASKYRFGTETTQYIQFNFTFYESKDNLETKNIFTVGIGNDSDRKNGFVVDDKGTTYAQSTTIQGADYAEYFEWLDGNPNAEDRIGYIVTLSENKIRKANSWDNILGIISGDAGVIGDTPEWSWHNKYLTDEFGRIQYHNVEVEKQVPSGELGENDEPIMETVTHIESQPILNPEYDPAKPYIPRSQRPEWAVVGLMGKIYVRDDGTCVPGGYAKAAEGGIATTSIEQTNMRVLNRVNENVVRVFLK